MSAPRLPPEIVTGYVLAGGRSSRMGTDKALLAVEGVPLLELALRTLRQVCATTAILSGPHDVERESILSAYGRVVPDGVELSAGPLAGLAAALADCATPYALLLAVDQPSVPPATLKVLVQESAVKRAGAACFSNAGRREPLPLIVSSDLGLAISHALFTGERRLLPTVESCAGASGRGFLALDAPDGSAAWFTNLNTPDDLQRWRLASDPNQNAQNASELENE